MSPQVSNRTLDFANEKAGWDRHRASGRESILAPKASHMLLSNTQQLEESKEGLLLVNYFRENT